MVEKKVEFGTKHNVTVDSAGTQLIIVVAHEINEGFALIGHGLKTLPVKGDKGTIVFERGGPTGGFWQYYPSK